MEDCPIELLGLEIGKGWFPLVKPIIDRVQDLNENGSDVKILQIKEKWGVLRIYLLSAPEELLKQAHDAEEKSTRICEECGGPATQTEVNGWIYTRCSDCLEKLRRHNLSNQRLLWKCSCLTCARFTNYHSDLLCGDINTSIPKEVDILKGCDKWIEGNTNWYLIPSEDGFIKKVLTKEEENEIYNEFVCGNNPCDRMSEERLELAQHIKWRRLFEGA